MRRIISCAGFGNSGSSIITDFFQEFSCIKNVGGSSFEFLLLHEPDGIMDLEKALVEGNRLKTDVAIKRFLRLIHLLNDRNPSGPNYKDYFNNKFLFYSEEYLKDLGVIEWKYGWWHRIFEGESINKFKRLVLQTRFKKIYKKTSARIYETDNWEPSYTLFTTEYYCKISKEEFVLKTKKYLNNLLNELDSESEYIFFDQLFPSNCDSDYLSFFDDIKVILVNRDPRDLYFLNKVFWGSGYLPTENVDLFINWYRKTRQNINLGENILIVNFEDMIFKHDETKLKISNFVGISLENHDMPRTRLFIDKSQTNTKVYSRYILDDLEYEKKIKLDLRQIEKELDDYIYDFDKYIDNEKIQKTKQSFIYETAARYVESKHIFFFEILICCISRFLRRRK